MCGIFGMYGHKEAAKYTYLGLYALQHRGEESAGILVSDGKKIKYHKGMGLVSDVFEEKILKSLRGSTAIGHVRYSTTGSSSAKNIQPFFVNHKKGHISIAHNGNLTNAFLLRNQMEESGSVFQTTMDSEIIVHLIAQSSQRNVAENVAKTLSQVKGAYSLVMILDDVLVGARDPYGWRPLCIGKLKSSFVLASETCALDLIGAEYLRDVEPGEVVCIGKEGFKSFRITDRPQPAFCIFEYIYFSRPDSNIFGNNVHIARKRLGVQLAKECPAKCDFVMPIPDSGTHAALGFSQESKIPFEIGMIRNHYIGRTFIQPSQCIRDFRVRVKLNPIKDMLKNKRVLIVEDSIVRGTTSRGRVRALREAGVKEVHMRVSCPPLRFPCYYGIDFPTKKELIAANHSIEWVKDFIGLDSLQYLSLDGMLSAMSLPRDSFCTACFNGKYPEKIPRRFSKNILERTGKSKKK
ncbi:MAG: amidophosphoribosyltransferase [Candidatus Omnitrophota bacterium]